MKARKKIALVTGGYTGEWEISLKSARNVSKQLDKDRYDVYTIYIARSYWYYLDASRKKQMVDKNDFSVTIAGKKIRFDVVFICIHGTPGEDGRLQGYFDMLGLLYTSCSQLTAAVSMNKYYTKAIIAHIPGIRTARSALAVQAHSALDTVADSSLVFPLLIKPNNGGSSLGMSLVKQASELPGALSKAFSEDPGGQIIVEEFIAGREVSVGVYRSATGITVLPASEVKVDKGYFDFDTKYHAGGPVDITPAPLAPELSARLERAAARIFEVLFCKGVVRIDFIIQAESEDLYFLELNSIPAHTDVSFVPKQLRAAGIDPRQFYHTLVEEALQQPGIPGSPKP